jgi:16S rRNA G527 N7-methylase RsmG
MEFGKWGELIEVFLAKNSQINLSAIRDADGVYVKHILDSLELLKIFSFVQGQRVCDLGTG